MSWPPLYKLRHSKRAKRISMRIYPGVGLEVIVPIKKNMASGLQFLNDNRAWVEKHLSQHSIDHSSLVLPLEINLHAINKRMEIAYYPFQATRVLSHRIERDRLIFYGQVNDFSVCRPVILKWLKAQAKQGLGNLLDAYSKQYQLPYAQMSIRAQKTVWGSCTRDKNIQLNYKLLFLPPELVHYVLVHELCHTMHLNHSLRFWKMVGKFVPDYRVHTKALRDVDRFIPKWLYQ